MDFSCLGFNLYQVLLVLACTVGAVFGSIAHVIVATISADGPPTHDDDMRLASPHLQEMRGTWIYLRMLLGGILGFVFGLYFVGMTLETPANFAKVWALSFLVGYAAPKIWAAKEEALMQRVKAESAELPK